MKYQYVAVGKDAPEEFKYMNKIKFKLGEVKDITDPEVLKKIDGNPSFIAVTDKAAATPKPAKSVTEKVTEAVTGKKVA